MTSFADILGGPRELVLKGDLHVTYKPDIITPAMLEDILVSASSDDNLRILGAYKKTLPKFLDSWDLTNEGEAVPITPDGIADVPLAILDLVFTGIMEDREERRSEEGNGSAESTAVSPSGSTTATSTGTRRNGTATSPRPASIT